MKIWLKAVGKPHESFVKEGTDLFTKRLSHYFAAEWQLIPMPKNSGTLSPIELKKKEGEAILQTLQKEDYLVLLDERGKSLSSEGLANFIEQRANDSVKNLVFLIGGAYGVSEAVQERSQFTWSLSTLVFPHQLVRLVLSEQLYRACTIIRNEKYHHT